jgi:hypothetical protein
MIYQARRRHQHRSGAASILQNIRNARLFSLINKALARNDLLESGRGR